jgi:thiazole synthase ThiGH ThiG subunit
MNRVEKFITELVSMAKDLCPEAEITISTTSIEGEDAKIKVIVPSERFDKVEDPLTLRAYEILLDEGYQILVHVYDRDELALRMASAGST